MTAHPFSYHNGEYWCDNSAISSYLECSRNYEYEYQELRVATFNRVALNYGKGIHVGLAVLSKQCGNDYSSVDLAQLDKVVDDYFDRNPQPLDDHRQASLAKETLHRYVKLYERESWTIRTANGLPFIERLIHAKFSEYNGIPINFFGVVDLCVLASDQRDWIVDRKGQMKGYCWLFKQAFGKLPQGYIVDAIRSLAPSEKALSDQKALDKWWLEQFRRLPFYVDQDKVDEWELNTHRYLKKMIRDFEEGTYVMNTKSCVSKYGRCQFYDICSLPFPQRIVALQSNNFTENDWIERTLGGKV